MFKTQALKLLKEYHLSKMVKKLIEITLILCTLLRTKNTYMQVNQHLFKTFGHNYQVVL